MLFNSDKFGQKSNIITDSVFDYFNFDGGFIPPPPTYMFLIDNDDDYLIDNEGYFLTES